MHTYKILVFMFPYLLQKNEKVSLAVVTVETINGGLQENSSQKFGKTVC
jgi:hypothetical protein